MSFRTVSPTTATAIAIADMIGTGVFTSLGFQVKDITSPFAIMVLWVVGGAVALCGALSYAELSTAFPRSGGEYTYLSRIYRPAVGFAAGWVSATVGFAAPVALAAMAFGSYLQGVLPGIPALLAGIAAIWAVSAIHLLGMRQGTVLQNASTAIKLALILVLIVAGFLSPPAPGVSFMPSVSDLDTIAGAPFAISLVFVLYAYSGWNAATYIASEIEDPARTLPRSITIAVCTVILLYLALNAVFLYTTPMTSLSGQIDVALIAGRSIFGADGGKIAATLICIGLVSSISAMMWIGPRVTMVMGEDIPLLRVFSRKTRTGTPAVALLTQLSIATLLLLTQSFEAVLEFIQFSLTLCSFLAVLGVIVLRYTQPSLPRPYKVWAYPVTPFIFLSVTLFMMVHLIAERPIQSLAGLLTLASGLVLYGLSMKHKQQIAVADY